MKGNFQKTSTEDINRVTGDAPKHVCGRGGRRHKSAKKRVN